MNPLDLVRLSPLMERSQGRPQIGVALIDGPVVMDHPDLAGATIREVHGELSGSCTRTGTVACGHATFVAGILFARRGSVAPAICPGCTLLVRSIFSDAANGGGQMPSATLEQLADAVVGCVKAGANVINLSSSLVQPSVKGERKLQEALNYAAHRGVITVAAAGNQGSIGSSAITRHPWVIPVAACNVHGKPLRDSNLASSIGRRGLSAPGENITSLGTNGPAQTLSGTSAAAAFVTGTIALLWSEFSRADAAAVKLAITQFGSQPRNTLIPLLLDAWAAYQTMASWVNRRVAS